jgi:hypothetical protein
VTNRGGVLQDKSKSPRMKPRPLAWVALGVSTVVTVLVWLSSTEPVNALMYAWFLNDFIPEVAFFGIITVVAAIVAIVAGWRGRANRILALIALAILFAPLTISVISIYLP